MGKRLCFIDRNEFSVCLESSSVVFDHREVHPTEPCLEVLVIPLSGRHLDPGIIQLLYHVLGGATERFEHDGKTAI
jgi:hypothetical protein